MRPRGTSTIWGSATASFPRSTRVSSTSGWGSGARGAFGGTPTRSGWWLADQVGGTFGAMGAMAALFARERFLGTGQFVECTAAEGVMRIIDYNWGWHGMDGSVRPRYGN